MKKINLFIISLALVVCSCSKDDALVGVSSDLSGTWIATSVNYSGEMTGEVVSSTFTGEGYDIDFTVTFNDSPKTCISNGSYWIRLTQTFDEETFTSDIEQTDFLNDGTWDKNGTTLIIESQGEETEFIIEKLTANELVISSDTITDSTMEGIAITNTIVAKITFKK